MQAATYAITCHSAKVFKDLLAFLGEDVFDELQRDGATAKSEGFLKMIRDARSALEEISADDGTKPEGE